jgi:hypothetical protein
MWFLRETKYLPLVIVMLTVINVFQKWTHAVLQITNSIILHIQNIHQLKLFSFPRIFSSFASINNY